MRIESIEQLEQLRFDSDGLIPLIVQHALTGEVLMLGYANRESLVRTLSTNTVWFYSRSRAQLWQKGETSGNILSVLGLHADCDQDALLARAAPAGPTCHTGARSCFDAPPTLTALTDTIDKRSTVDPSGSYTARLLGDKNMRLKKLGEEAVEFALACDRGDVARIPEEAADLFYHVLVAAHAANAGLEQILAVLSGRAGPSAAGR